MENPLLARSAQLLLSCVWPRSFSSPSGLFPFSRGGPASPAPSPLVGRPSPEAAVHASPHRLCLSDEPTPCPVSLMMQPYLSVASSSSCHRRFGLHRRAECPCPSRLRIGPRAPHHHVTALPCHPRCSAPIKSRAAMSPRLKPRHRCGTLAPP